MLEKWVPPLALGLRHQRKYCQSWERFVGMLAVQLSMGRLELAYQGRMRLAALDSQIFIRIFAKVSERALRALLGGDTGMVIQNSNWWSKGRLRLDRGGVEGLDAVGGVIPEGQAAALVAPMFGFWLGRRFGWLERLWRLPVVIQKVFWCSSGCHPAMHWSWWHLSWCWWRGGWHRSHHIPLGIICFWFPHGGKGRLTFWALLLGAGRQLHQLVALFMAAHGDSGLYKSKDFLYRN